MRKKNGIFILGTQTEAIALSYEAEIIKKKEMYKDGENVEQQKNILFFVFFIRLARRSSCYGVFKVMQFWNRNGFPFPNSALT